jgi:hypothetical protein
VSNKKPRLRVVEEGRIGVEEREREREVLGDFRELDRSANKHEFSLGWVKRDRRLEGIQSAMLEKRAPRLLAVDAVKASEEGEKDM